MFPAWRPTHGDRTTIYQLTLRGALDDRVFPVTAALRSFRRNPGEVDVIGRRSAYAPARSEVADEGVGRLSDQRHERPAGVHLQLDAPVERRSARRGRSSCACRRGQLLDLLGSLPLCQPA